MPKTYALCLPLLFSLGLAAPDPDAVLKAALDHLRGQSLRATLAVRVLRPEGERRYLLEVVSDGGERSLVRVLAPPEAAGQAFLRLGEDLLFYDPALKRTLPLPPGGGGTGFLGSDLAYGDLAGRDLEEAYTPRLLAEGEEVSLELTPKPQAPTPYGRVVLRARAGTWEPLEVVFYDQRGQAVRRVRFGRYTGAPGRRWPLEIAVEDLLRPGHRTLVLYQTYRLGPVPEGCFRPQALEGGC